MRFLLRCLPLVALAAAALAPAAAQRPTVRPAPALTLTYANIDAYRDQRGVVVPLDTLLFVANPGTFEARVPSVTGTVYVYALRQGAYILTDSVAAPVGLTLGSRFGDGVAAHGNTLAVGAPGYNARPDSDIPFPSGEVFVYNRQTNGSYELVQRLVRPDEGNRTVFRFGEEVHLDGDAMIISGPPTSGETFKRHGGIYRYVRSGSIWSLEAKLWGDVVGYPSIRYESGLQIINSFSAAFRARVMPGLQVPESAEYFGEGWYLKSKTFPAGVGQSAMYRDVDYDAATGITRVLTENLTHVVGRDVAQPGFSPSIGIARETTLLSDTTFLWGVARGSAIVGAYTLVTVPRSANTDDPSSVVLAFTCPATPEAGTPCQYVGRFSAHRSDEVGFGVWASMGLTGTMRGTVLASSTETASDGSYTLRYYLLRPSFVSTSAEAPQRNAPAVQMRVWPSVATRGASVRVSVEGTSGGACRLTLLDALGRDTAVGEVGADGSAEVATGGLAAGLYRVRATCGAVASSAPLVVRR